jgi:hypothetical protein
VNAVPIEVLCRIAASSLPFAHLYPPVYVPCGCAIQLSLQYLRYTAVPWPVLVDQRAALGPRDNTDLLHVRFSCYRPVVHLRFASLDLRSACFLHGEPDALLILHAGTHAHLHLALPTRCVVIVSCHHA